VSRTIVRMITAVLEAQGLVKRYGDAVALDGVDLTVRVGESLAIMGASGSGKTTLLHCLAGIVVPDGGRVTLATANGRLDMGSISDEERSELRRTTFGFVFQQGLLIPELTAVENVSLPMLLAGASRREAERQASAGLASLGLEGLDHRRLGQLSGGQAQRVAIARAQVMAPAVVFADEPTGALDSRTSMEVLDALIASTTGRGRTLVVVTHESAVARRCDRTVHLSDGCLTGVDEHRSAS